MPLNEILAPSYAIIRYHVLENVPHQFRLYFNTVPSLDGDNGWLFSTYTDAGHSGGWHLNEIVAELFERAALDSSRATKKLVDGVEMWASEEGANLFLGLDTGDYTDIDPAAASPIAAAYTMHVFKSALRFPFRLSFFDTGDSRPQRFSGNPIPDVDNGGIAWFMTRSAVGFVTNDGYELAIHGSYNTGYNRKLARSYGRQIQP